VDYEEIPKNSPPPSMLGGVMSFVKPKKLQSKTISIVKDFLPQE
jgi:hypothetical protein